MKHLTTTLILTLFMSMGAWSHDGVSDECRENAMKEISSHLAKETYPNFNSGKLENFELINFNTTGWVEVLAIVKFGIQRSIRHDRLLILFGDIDGFCGKISKVSGSINPYGF